MMRKFICERAYQHALQQKYKYGPKQLKSGVTDITTPNKHIEIKRWPCWKHSLGQLLSYDHYDKKPELEAHLFGEYAEYKKEIAREVFTKYNIKVVDLGFTLDSDTCSSMEVPE